MRWLRRVRGALGMGLTWAIAWAVIGGGLMEAIVDPHGRILDMWPQTLAIPGFLGCVVFSMVLWVAEGGRRFEELSIRRFAAWGAVAGVLLGGVALGLGFAGGVTPLWLRGAVAIGPLAVLNAASAAGSLAIAKKAVAGDALDAGGSRERLAGRG